MRTGPRTKEFFGDLTSRKAMADKQASPPRNRRGRNDEEAGAKHEFQETVNKAKAMLKAMALAETFR